jgi:hypothetical protein
MVVRPIISHAIIMWWSKVEYKTSRAEISKVQRLTYSGATGTMKTASIPAIEVLLEILTSHLKMEAETQA